MGLFLEFEAYHDVLVVVHEEGEGLDDGVVGEPAGEGEEADEFVGVEGEVQFLLAAAREPRRHGHAVQLEGDFLLAGVVIVAALEVHSQQADGARAVLVERETWPCLVEPYLLEGILELLLEFALGDGLADARQEVLAADVNARSVIGPLAAQGLIDALGLAGYILLGHGEHLVGVEVTAGAGLSGRCAGCQQ